MKNINKFLEFIPSQKYITNLETELSADFEKITFYYFKITAQGMFEKIAAKLFESLEKGREVELYLDAVYSKLIFRDDSLYYPLTKKGKIANQIKIDGNLNLFKELETKGAKIFFYNEPNSFLLKLLPFARRDHRKIIIIKRFYGTTTYFGATNFGEADVHDFMIKISDHKLAEKIAEISSWDFIKEQKEDFILEINPNLKFFLDIGKSFQSKILHQGYKMISQARKRIIFTSQLPAELPLIFKFILARINGASVKIILPPADNKYMSKFPTIVVFWMNLFFAKLFGISLVHSFDEFSHSKLLVCDDAVLLGSHNLSNMGVWVGTAEFSAYVKEEKFLQKILNHIDFIEGKKDLSKDLVGREFV